MHMDLSPLLPPQKKYDEMQIESKFVLSTKLSVEGPLRMKEEYVEGTMESPTIIEETLPEQLKGALGQATNTMQQLPVPIRDAITSGLTIPLGNLLFYFILFYNYNSFLL